ncbi:MAG: universal stress protein [Dehalococcoidia bacterium]|nr:universal stress protein [Dehalococcoidia bacterium]
MTQKILVPLDGSDFAEAILDDVVGLAAGGRAEVVLLRVQEAPTEVMVEQGRVIYLDEQMSWVESEMTEYLKIVERRLRSRGMQVTSAMSFGDTATEILRYAQDNDVDLIAMTTHARSGLEALWRGSVARDVYYKASVPVLLKRLSEKEVAERAA